MSLLRAEVRRLTKRRFTRWMLAILVLVLGTVVVSMSLASQERTPAVVAEAQVKSQAEFQEQVRYHQEAVKECEAAKARGEDITKNFPPDCGAGNPPTADMFDPSWHMPFEFHFRELFPGFVAVFFGILAMFAFLVGASFVGAEWNTGGMMNLLLWRPKRVPVLLTKLVALLGGVLVTGVVLGGLWTLAFWLIGWYDGQTGQLTAGMWQSLALSGLRGLALALVVAAVGFGLASLGRHTAMALGVAVGIGMIGEIGLRLALSIAEVPFEGRFLLSTYALGWFLKEWTLVNYSSCQVDPTGQCEPAQFVVTWQTSGLVLGIGAALVLGAAFWTMRKRDIT